ncbi:MAG: DUF1415 family protein [Myxococcales bacterium]
MPSPDLHGVDTVPWEREALRLCDRYVREVVLPFGLCPWAEPALRAGRVTRAVCLAEAPTAADCLPFIERLRSESSIDVAFLVFPRHATGWAAFDSFAERVRRAEREQPASRASGQFSGDDGVSGTFMVAAFHPQGAESFSNPHQLISFLRRTADPTLQFVRAELLERLKQTQPDISDAVGRHNHAAVLKDDIQARLERTIASIAADREATYAALRGEYPGERRSRVRSS